MAESNADFYCRAMGDGLLISRVKFSGEEEEMDSISLVATGYHDGVMERTDSGIYIYIYIYI